MRIKHRIELALTCACVLVSFWHALHGQWAAGEYFLVLAGVLELDDWRTS